MKSSGWSSYAKRIVPMKARRSRASTSPSSISSRFRESTENLSVDIQPKTGCHKKEAPTRPVQRPRSQPDSQIADGFERISTLGGQWRGSPLAAQELKVAAASGFGLYAFAHQKSINH